MKWFVVLSFSMSLHASAVELISALAGAIIYSIPAAVIISNKVDEKEGAKGTQEEAARALSRTQNELSKFRVRRDIAVRKLNDFQQDLQCVQSSGETFKSQVAWVCGDNASAMVLNNLEVKTQNDTLVEYASDFDGYPCDNTLGSPDSVPVCSVNGILCPCYWWEDLCPCWNDKVIYGQSVQDLQIRSGNWAVGSGTRLFMNCPLSGFSFEIYPGSQAQSIDYTNFDPGNFQVTTNRTSTLEFRVGISQTRFRHILSINSSLNASEISTDINEFIHQNCQAINWTEYLNASNDTLRSKRSEIAAQSDNIERLENTTKNQTYWLEYFSHESERADDQYWTALKIHLPILFVAAPLIFYLTAKYVQSRLLENPLLNAPDEPVEMVPRILTSVDVTQPLGDCSICLGAVTNLRTLQPCGHVFCALCIAPWLVSHTTCPNCRVNTVLQP